MEGQCGLPVFEQDDVGAVATGESHEKAGRSLPGAAGSVEFCIDNGSVRQTGVPCNGDELLTRHAAVASVRGGDEGNQTISVPHFQLCQSAVGRLSLS